MQRGSARRRTHKHNQRRAANAIPVDSLSAIQDKHRHFTLGWLEENRSDAAASSETKDAFLYRTGEAYSNLTGVSLDEEMAILLELEQSYKATTRIISAVDEMLQALLMAAG